MKIKKMRIIYCVSYSDHGRVKFEHFDFLNHALNFINLIQQSGKRATLRKIPLKECLA